MILRIYDYLFYKSYLLGEKSGNFKYCPVLGGIIGVTGCSMLNVFTIMLFLEGYLQVTLKYPSNRFLNFLYTGVYLLLVYFYYVHKNRYLNILEKYAQKDKNSKSVRSAIWVMCIYLFVSLCLLFLAGFYRNKDWIFS